MGPEALLPRSQLLPPPRHLQREGLGLPGPFAILLDAHLRPLTTHPNIWGSRCPGSSRALSHHGWEVPSRAPQAALALSSRKRQLGLFSRSPICPCRALPLGSNQPILLPRCLVSGLKGSLGVASLWLGAKHARKCDRNYLGQDF